jgi:hypothetical protein
MLKESTDYLQLGLPVLQRDEGLKELFNYSILWMHCDFLKLGFGSE